MSRVDIRAILSDRVQRRELMIPVIQTIQAREGVETTREQAERAYDAVASSKERSLAPLDTIGS